MAISKTLAIALMLTANTSPASKAISNFTKDSEKKIERLQKASEQWNKWGNNNIVKGTAMAAPLVLAAKAAADLEDKTADVAKVANVDFGSKQFHKLEADAMRISETLGVSATNVGELMAELAAGGVSADRLDRVALMAGKIGVAFDVAAGEAGKSFMVIQNAMNLTEKETKTVMDAMNAATNKFGGKASELLNFMAQGGASVANTLKVSGVAMQAFGNAFQVVGINSAEAATTMERFQKAVLTNATSAKIFNKAGGGTQGMLAILEKAKASGNAAKWLLANGFGEYSTKLAQLANNMDSGKGVKSQLKHLSTKENVEGSSDKEFAARMKTTNQQLKILKEQGVNAASRIGSTLLPVITNLTKQAGPLIKRITTWIENNQKLTGQIIKGAAAFAVGRVALGGVQKAVGSVIGTFKNLKTAWNVLKTGRAAVMKFYQVFKLSSQLNAFARGGTLASKAMGLFKGGILNVGKALGTAAKFLMSNPILLLVAAIAAGAYLIYKNWDKIKAWFIKLWANVKKAFSAAWEWIKKMFMNYTPHGLIIKHWDKIKGWFSGLWDWVKGLFNSTWEWIKSMFLNYTPQGLIIKHWEPIKKFFSDLWDSVKKKFMAFVNWFSEKWKWVNNNIIKPITSFVSGPSGNINVNYPGPTPLPQPVPIGRTNNNSVTYAPVINMNGGDTRSTVAMSSRMRRDFEQTMNDYNHNKERKTIG